MCPYDTLTQCFGIPTCFLSGADLIDLQTSLFHAGIVRGGEVLGEEAVVPLVLSKDHKPGDAIENRRIEKAGGIVVKRSGMASERDSGVHRHNLIAIKAIN